MRKLILRLRELIKFRLFRPLLLGIGNRMGKYSTVGDHPIFDNQQFTWTDLLENNWHSIRKELEGILHFHQKLPNIQDIQQEQNVLNQDNYWKTFFLFGFGIKATLNCQSCPVTTSLLEQIPGMKTAFFSVLSPHKHIPAHKGIFKGLIRSHLGLIIPGKPGDCVMRIENEYIYWQEGKSVVFDDTYEHEVWNNTGEVRVVLLIDVIRPFKSHLTLINNKIINLIGNSSYVKEAMENHKKWENNFYSEPLIIDQAVKDVRL
ncbi:MAG: aspartyl/asparaginyl beta-hydroxylase domain-containing protein [Bacteroidota bacterium]|nr:aspartyl/asparaginyl beta-hydroxylase domain-containing protein [Bacteroidota bacterium]